MSGIKVAFLSDLHIKNVGVREKKVLEILREEKPDLILLGGDYINSKGFYQPAISFFQQLQAKHGIYAVMGNTEYSNENGSCILCHQEKSKNLKDGPSPTFLRNSATPVKLNEKVLNLIGLDDPVEKKGDLRAAVKYRTTKSPSLLLAHSPEIFKEAAQWNIDLLLSGHNHGGQFFLMKYLRKILKPDRASKFLEGFYQDKETLMYVSRGVGTSFLPFRFGVRPEITFFTFTNGPGLSKETFKITNSPSKSKFAGISFYSFIDLFDFFPRSSLREIFDSDDLTPYASNPSAHHVLFDFESEADLEKLNWECHKWFERSLGHATSGEYSLRVLLPPGQYPGINFQGIKKDWSEAKYIRLDVFNPSEENFIFHVRIDDHKSGWEYANRFDKNFELKRGMNRISIPTNSLKANIHSRSLDLRNIKRLVVFVPNNRVKRELFLDNIRLE